MRTVFTNGCFEILHLGHIRLFQFAKSLGDWLVVGVNTDASFRSNRDRDPIIPDRERYEMIRLIKYVDEVLLFSEPTPENMIERIRPQVLVKGPERANEEIPGASFVESIGGDVITAPWDKDHSTSEIIRKIQELRLRYCECGYAINDIDGACSKCFKVEI